MSNSLYAELSIVIVEYFKGFDYLITGADCHLSPCLDDAYHASTKVLIASTEGLFIFGHFLNRLLQAVKIYWSHVSAMVNRDDANLSVDLKI